MVEYPRGVAKSGLGQPEIINNCARNFLWFFAVTIRNPAFPWVGLSHSWRTVQ
jgi:hypothetical protein